MIRRTADLSELSGVQSPLFPRIAAALGSAYGASEGVFIQSSGEKSTTVFSAISGNYTVIESNFTDYEELYSFFNLNGIVSLTSLSDKCLKSFRTKLELPLLKYKGANTDLFGQEHFAGCEISLLNSASSSADYSGLYSCLFGTGEGFSDWYTEFSLKIVKGLSFAVVVKDSSDNTVSCAVSPSAFEDSAIISGVASLPSDRGRGFASAAILRLLAELQDKGKTNIYLWCEQSMVSYYTARGFAPEGKIFVGFDYNGIF